MSDYFLSLEHFPRILAWFSLALATLPALLFVANLPFYRRLPGRLATSPDERGQARSSDLNPGNPGTTVAGPFLSVLIPARNEEAAIVPALRSILDDPHPRLEVLVLDDHSTDATASQVLRVATTDPRVRLVTGKRLPEGWCGKQHACWQLAQAAQGELLVFLDADVRLAPQALTRIARYFETHPDVQLASGVPRQLTGTFLEKLLIPLIHTILLGYLPMVGAQWTRWSAFAAGCGQLFVARRGAYFTAGGHQNIRSSLHDGVQLPRLFRRHGLQTGLFDATDLADCRMYSSASTVWRGLGKNATEGMAHPAAIVPWSVLLLSGHVLPWILLAVGLLLPIDTTTLVIAGIAASLGALARLAAAWRFRQNLLGALLHPLGVTALVLIQWDALVRRWRGRPMEWRGRQYAHPASVPANSHPTA
jgi:hypothetical protein